MTNISLARSVSFAEQKRMALEGKSRDIEIAAYVQFQLDYVAQSPTLTQAEPVQMDAKAPWDAAFTLLSQVR
jgi:hypothetical protein